MRLNKTNFVAEIDALYRYVHRKQFNYVVCKTMIEQLLYGVDILVDGIIDKNNPPTNHELN